MTRSPGGKLYSPKFLALAVELADYPHDAAAPLQGESRSRTCGSEILLSAGRDLRAIGLRVSACAVGQAASAIFARHAAGSGEARLAEVAAQIEGWLGGDERLPDWPEIELLAPARAHPGRHGAILLPWRAALDALGKAQAAR